MEIRVINYDGCNKNMFHNNIYAALLIHVNSIDSIPIKNSFQENISQPMKSQAVVLHKSGKILTKRIR